MSAHPALFATSLIPETHATAELGDDADARLMYAAAAAGNVVVTKAQLLHGASINRDGRHRSVIHGYFTRRGRKYPSDFRYYGSPASLAKLPPACRALLDLKG